MYTEPKDGGGFVAGVAKQIKSKPKTSAAIVVVVVLVVLAFAM